MEKIKFIYIGKEKIEYQLIWSSRKTVGISIDPEHGVVVRAPKYLGEKRVTELVQEKSLWIAEKWNDMEKQRMQKPNHHYEEGDKFLYMGKSFSLRIERDTAFKTCSTVLQEGEIKVFIPVKYEEADREIIKKSLELWYRREALDYLNKRIRYFSSYVSVCPKAVIVKEQKRRWGSCSSEGILRFNWRCIMAPPEIIDYVVVHEMCHLEQMNHGEKFWEMVKGIIPHYLERKQWLKQYGHTLE